MPVIASAKFTSLPNINKYQGDNFQVQCDQKQRQVRDCTFFFSSPGYLRYFVCCRIGGDICYFRYRQRESDILDIIFAMFRHVYLMFQLFWIFDNLDMLLQNIRMYLQYLIFWIFWILNVFLAYWKLVDISAILDNSLQISDISDTSDILDILCELVLNVASTRYIRYFRYF